SSASPWNAPGKATRNGFGQAVTVARPNPESGFYFTVKNPNEALSFHGPLTYENRIYLVGSGTFYLHGPVSAPDKGKAFPILSPNTTGWVVATSDVQRVLQGFAFQGVGTRFWLGGGLLSNTMLRLGNGGNSRNAIWQTGGEFHSIGDNYIGENIGSYGAWVQEGGCSTFSNAVYVGARGGQGVLVQKGGLFDLERNGVLSIVDRQGTATAYIAGGTNDTILVQDLPNGAGTRLRLAPDGGVATLTVTGPDTLLRTETIEIGCATNVSTNVVNLTRGGTFEARRFLCKKGRPAPSCVTINADGGILKPTFAYGWNHVDSNSSEFFKRSPDHFVIHAGGLVLDTSGCLNSNNELATTSASEFPFSLSAPTGRRIASITLPATEEFAALAYAAPAIIDIEGPEGSYGASAFADFDFRAEKLTGVTVTSGGCDYDETTKVYVYSPDGKTRHECAYTLEANPSGGALVKRGAVDLNIHAPQTYTGGTIVESGRLRFANADTFPANTPAEVWEGAVLDLADHDATVSALAGAGTVANGNVTVTARLELTARELFARREPLKIAKACHLADGVTVVVRDPENLEDY
ncbi:MAG: hypothetical protein ACI4RA_08215, partial [Kiritimatiellia bacterium]